MYSLKSEDDVRDRLSPLVLERECLGPLCEMVEHDENVAVAFCGHWCNRAHYVERDWLERLRDLYGDHLWRVVGCGLGCRAFVALLAMSFNFEEP